MTNPGVVATSSAAAPPNPLSLRRRGEDEAPIESENSWEDKTAFNEGLKLFPVASSHRFAQGCCLSIITGETYISNNGTNHRRPDTASSGSSCCWSRCTSLVEAPGNSPLGGCGEEGSPYAHGGRGGVGCSVEAEKRCSSPLPHWYEEEINKRRTAENDFVLLKKVRPNNKEGTPFLKAKRI